MIGEGRELTMAVFRQRVEFINLCVAIHVRVLFYFFLWSGSLTRCVYLFEFIDLYHLHGLHVFFASLKRKVNSQLLKVNCY